MQQKNAASSPHPAALWLLKAMLLLLGVSAVAPGINMLLDPTGKGIGFPEGSLSGSPFSNYFIPGILLTVFNGLLPLVAWFSLWRKPNVGWLQRINPFPKRHWAWALALISGTGLMIWIAVQVLMVPYFFLQPVLFSWGAIIVLLCFSPGVRAYYTPVN